MTARRSDRVELVTRALQASPSPAELGGEAAAVATFRRAHEVAAAEVAAFPEPRPQRRADRTPPRLRLRARVLAAAGPLTVGASVVAVTALAVPVLTGLVDRSPSSSSTAVPVVTRPATQGGQPGPVGDATLSPTVGPSATTVTPPAPAPTASTAPGVVVRPTGATAARTTAPDAPEPSTPGTSTAGTQGPDRGGQGKAADCRTWLLVRPDSPLGQQLLVQLSDGRTHKSHASDVTAVDNFCRSVVGQNPPRCRADGSIDPSALREGRSAWRQNPWYAPWCQAVTGHASALCSPWGCPPVWWRCPTWGCLAVPKTAQSGAGSAASAGGAASGRRTTAGSGG